MRSINRSLNVFLFLICCFYSQESFSSSVDTPLLERGMPSAPVHAGHNFGGVSGGISGGDFSTHVDAEVRMDVSGHARVALGDYFDTSTHVYQTLQASPHKELFEQMKPQSLMGFASNAALVLEFEVAAKDFAETMGPGLTSSLYPKALNVYERLSHRGHPIASERYGDHLLLAVQVEIDRNVMGASMFCPPIDYFLGIKKTKEMCEKVRSAYASAFNAYLPEAEHTIHLRGKLGDVNDIEKATVDYYKRKMLVYFAPVACCSVFVAIALFSALGASN